MLISIFRCYFTPAAFAFGRHAATAVLDYVSFRRRALRRLLAFFFSML